MNTTAHLIGSLLVLAFCSGATIWGSQQVVSRWKATRAFAAKREADFGNGIELEACRLRLDRLTTKAAQTGLTTEESALFAKTLRRQGELLELLGQAQGQGLGQRQGTTPLLA